MLREKESNGVVSRKLERSLPKVVSSGSGRCVDVRMNIGICLYERQVGREV